VAYYYASTMTGNETNTYSAGAYLRCFLDPSGADRTFQPNAGFPTGFEFVIINTGNYVVTFDPATLSKGVGPGDKQRFYFNGTIWY